MPESKKRQEGKKRPEGKKRKIGIIGLSDGQRQNTGRSESKRKMKDMSEKKIILSKKMSEKPERYIEKKLKRE